MVNRILKHFSLFIVTLFCLALVLMPFQVFAAPNRQIVSLKEGQWATQSYYKDDSLGWTSKYYKIVVFKAGKLNFKVAGSGYTGAELLTSFSDDAERISLNNNDTVVVEKGTYYLYVNADKCKFSFITAPLQSNYCWAKATKLLAKKTAKVYFTPTRNFSHWYKIKLPQKRKIKLSFSKQHDFIIYNSKGKVCSSIRNGSDLKYCTQKRQPKGTYYIRILSDDGRKNSYTFGEYVTFKWY